MKPSSLLFLSLIFSFFIIGQTKKEQKLLALLNSGSYEKMEKKSKKILRKDRSNTYANYCMSKLYLQKAVNRKSAASAKNYISRSLRYYKNIPQNKFMNYHEQVHEIIRKNALDSNQKVSINNQYRNWLLVYFGDSVPPFNSPIKLQIAILDSAKIGDSLRFEMLKTAKRLEGVPYKYAGTTPQGGFDCSGFTQYVYHSVGIELPHNANMQSQVSSKTIPLSKLEPGDLVFFGYEHNGETKAGHAGIIFAKSENGFTVIHCVNGGVKIEGENSSWDRYWINKVLYGISMNTLANK